MPSPLILIVVCAAGPAPYIKNLITKAHLRQWDVQVIATPSAHKMVDISAVHSLTGRPVRVSHDDPRTSPTRHPNAAIIAPATFNTINKLAGGIADNYALDVLHPMIGRKTPVVVLPLSMPIMHPSQYSRTASVFSRIKEYPFCLVKAVLNRTLQALAVIP